MEIDISDLAILIPGFYWVILYEFLFILCLVTDYENKDKLSRVLIKLK